MDYHGTWEGSFQAIDYHRDIIDQVSYIVCPDKHLSLYFESILLNKFRPIYNSLSYHNRIYQNDFICTCDISKIKEALTSEPTIEDIRDFIKTVNVSFNFSNMEMS